MEKILFESALGVPLDMGTEFDDISDLAKTTFFESEFDEKHRVSHERWMQIRANRRLFFNLMIEQGFTNHPFEWWHYNFGNHPWAEELATTWIYDSAEEKVLKIEKSLS
ncbi:MAG: M15 family metallopeptidase [Oligoflexales bacterium]